MAKRRRNLDILMAENPLGFDEFNNPIYFGNPRRRKTVARKHRNPAGALALPNMGGMTQGVGLMDVIGALSGVAVAAWLPGLVVKGTSTTGGKLMKVVVALAGTIGAGMVLNKVGGSRLGKAAIIGGLAGTAGMAVSTFTSVKIPGLAGGPALSGPRSFLGVPQTVSPSATREGENVTLLQP